MGAVDCLEQVAGIYRNVLYIPWQCMFLIRFEPYPCGRSGLSYVYDLEAQLQLAIDPLQQLRSRPVA